MVEGDWEKPNRWIGWLGKNRAMDRLVGKSGGAKALVCWSGKAEAVGRLVCWSGKARAVGQLVGKGQGDGPVGWERPKGRGVGRLVGEGQGGGTVGREMRGPAFSSSASDALVEGTVALVLSNVNIIKSECICSFCASPNQLSN